VVLGSKQGPGLEEFIRMRGAVARPSYLKGISANAMADSALLFRFESLLEHAGDISGLKGAVMNLTGKCSAPISMPMPL
jgi:hypothetical protein